MVIVSFPAQSVPDGNVWYPHHFVIGIWGLLFVAWLLTSDEDKPVLLVGGILVAMYGWYHVWPSLPLTGASLVLVGLVVATGALARRLWNDRDDRDRSDWSAGVELAATTFLVIAWDDVFSHAFGVYTPLDHLWAVLLAPLLV